MERYGDFFPENPQTLDELLEVMAQRMAAMQSMLNSMTPEQRAQLQGLAEQLLDDMDLRWQIDQLGQHLRSLFPQMGWDRRYNFEGQDPLGFAEADATSCSSSATSTSSRTCCGAPPTRARWPRPTSTGARPARRRRRPLARAPGRAGQDARGGRPHREQGGPLRADAEGHPQDRLERPRPTCSRKLAKDKMGQHQVDRLGVGHERTYEIEALRVRRPVQPRHPPHDPQRHPPHGRRHAGAPARPTTSRSSAPRTSPSRRTVLMLDLSLSMPMRDNFLAAKKVAMALHSLISSQFPRDYLGIVGFCEVARVLKAEQLPEVSWDFVYGTNMQHAFLLSPPAARPPDAARSRSS